METKTKTVNSGMKCGRRQLLLGSGLAPVVVTLHATKVFGQDGLPVGNPSGLAPFSGVIEGSLNPNGNPGNSDTEVSLYIAIADPNNSSLATYYGGIGYGDAGNFENMSWTYGVNGSYGENTPYKWTHDYEEQFVTKIEEYKEQVDELVSAFESFNSNHYVPTDDPVTTNPDNITIPMSSDEAVGVFEYVWDAKTIINTKYTNTKEAYRQAIMEYNANGQGTEGFQELAVPEWLST